MPRSDGRSLAASGGRLRRHRVLVPGLHGRGYGDRRARPDRAHRCPRLGAHGGGRGPDQSRGCPDLEARRCAPVRELDGGGGRSRGGRPALRCRRGRDGALYRTRDRHPGRQGLALDAHRMAGEGYRKGGDGAAHARCLGLRPDRRCAPVAHAGAESRVGYRLALRRSRARPEQARRFIARAGLWTARRRASRSGPSRGPRVILPRRPAPE